MDLILTTLTFITGGILALLIFSSADAYIVAGMVIDKKSFICIFIGLLFLFGGIKLIISTDRMKKDNTHTNQPNKNDAPEAASPPR